jgi:hypothetical protein
MELMELLRTSILASIVFSVIALPMASISALVFGYAFGSRIDRWKYMLAGVLGGAYR